MQEMRCPHCHADFPHGAKVCRGCQAEVEYGTPPAALMFVFLVALFSGWYAGASLHSIVGWIVFLSLGVGGIYACTRVFRNRVNFKRIYRTR